MADEPSPSEFLISKMEGMDEIMEQPGWKADPAPFRHSLNSFLT